MADRTVIDVLEATKTELGRRGWHQGALYLGATPRLDDPHRQPFTADCPVCLVAAVHLVCFRSPYIPDAPSPHDYRLRDRTIRTLGCTLRRPNRKWPECGPKTALADWQDDLDVIVDDVYALIDAAIADLRDPESRAALIDAWETSCDAVTSTSHS